jgi:hypothetical protein
LFHKWSKGYSLSIGDVKLRNKNWVEMLPKGPGDEDLDAIENEFFTIKGKAKTRQFLPNKVLDLYLGINYAMRSEIDNYIEEHSNDPVSVVSYYAIIVSIRTVMRLTLPEKGFYYGRSY